MEEPASYNLHNTKQIQIKTIDGLNIIAWYKAPENAQPVMLYLHGNAGNLGGRINKIRTFTNQGFGQLALSWRGYGSSGGYPSEEGLYNDARAAIQFLLDSDIKLHDIFIYGESLGTGVAVQMGMEYKVRNLILEAPYTSIANRAAELYPYFPVKFLLKDRFESIDKISSINIPVLIFHGYADNVMPIEHGKALFNKANEPKEAVFFQNTGHSDFDLNKLAQLTYEFVHRDFAEKK